MAQPTGYNQFSNYSPVPGQSTTQQGRQWGDTGPRNWQPGRTGQTPDAASAQGTSQYPQGTFPQPQATSTASQATTQAPAAGAAGQTPPATQSAPTTQPAPQQTPSYQPPSAQTYSGLGQQPTGHVELGNQGDAGAWTNGYNPHWVQDPMKPAPAPAPAAAQASTPASPPPQYPAGTFAPPWRRQQPQAPTTPAAAPPMPFSNDTSWMSGQADRAAAAGYPTSQSVDPMSGEGWKNGVSPQGFQAANPYYGQTGYYGDLGQVQAQMAGGAQSAGIPQGVLGASTYTQNPVGATPWQPEQTAQQKAAADLASWEANRWG